MNICVALVITLFIKSSHHSLTIARDVTEQGIIYIFVDDTYSERATQTVSIRAIETQLSRNTAKKPEFRISNVDKEDLSCNLISKLLIIHLSEKCLPQHIARNTPVLSVPVNIDNQPNSLVIYSVFSRNSMTELPVAVAVASKMNWTSALFVGDKQDDAFLERLLQRKRTFDMRNVISVEAATNTTNLYLKIVGRDSDFVLLHCHSCVCSEVVSKVSLLDAYVCSSLKTTKIQNGVGCELPASQRTTYGLQVAVQHSSSSNVLLQEVPFLHRSMPYCKGMEHCPSTTHQQLEVLDFYDSLIVARHLVISQFNNKLLDREFFVDAVNKAQLEGIRGTIRFDYSSTVIYPAIYKVLDISQFLVATIGMYDSSRSEWLQELTLFDAERSTFKEKRHRRELLRCAPAGRSFRVVTIKEPPFVIWDPNKEYPDPHHGNYTGIIIDILEWLVDDLGIEYTIYEPPDGKYGTVDNETDVGNGMVGELMECKADLAAAAFAITVLRSQYIHFTRPYIDVGYSLLRHKDEELSTVVWAFLKPFDLSTNVVIVCSFIFIWLSFLFVQRISPYAKSNNSEVDEDGKGWGLRAAEDSMWLLYASAMQQGPENVYSISGKILVGGWFFFCLVIISTYTANLAAFLTVKSFEDGITSLDDLAAQTEIVYGTVRDTSITEFFANSPILIHKRINTFITNTEEALVETRDEAIRRVREKTDGEYVFIWDQPILDYIATRRPCNTEVVGRPFNPHGYGLAMPQGMPYESQFSNSILKMRESGAMHSFMEKWLHGADCKSAISVKNWTDVDNVHLTDLIGVFIVLCTTTLASYGIAVFERLWWRRQSKNQNGGIANMANDVAAAHSVRNYDGESYV
ncbi:glutamate receptor ionotropic, kainate 2-like isoform X2 [Corticium candelabrum]|uniref:glutamate receptor ionotropic, kainate 2-like isoform X2 n=1 Tax=Corticium candelabrum TaxID=121492 RepID=UPI002E25A17B|nr:glutamate receptor ionotropic, kainate 2-like isoform X2 [Corticium candelabrum]